MPSALSHDLYADFAMHKTYGLAFRAYLKVLWEQRQFLQKAANSHELLLNPCCYQM